MQYPVPLEGFDGRQLVVETPGFFSSAKLMIDGQPVPKGAKRGEFLLHRNDGIEVTAKLKNMFLDPVPQVVIDNRVIKVVEPLRWYQWVWAGLPVLLVFAGGALGAVFGLIATSFNARLFRTEMSVTAQYGLVAIISIGAVLAYFLLATIVISLFR